MKYQDIAREAWDRINTKLQLGRCANKIGISEVLAAITKAREQADDLLKRAADEMEQKGLTEDRLVSEIDDYLDESKSNTEKASEQVAPHNSAFVRSWKSAPSPQQPASQQQEWTAGHDGMGQWAIYHGNETKKGWSGKGRSLVTGLSERQAKQVESYHNAALKAERDKLNKQEQQWLKENLRLTDELAAERAKAERLAITGKALLTEIRAYQSPECDDPESIGAPEIKAFGSALAEMEQKQ